MKPSTHRTTILIAKVAGELVFLYGLLAWLDGVFIQFIDPTWLSMPVSHLLDVRTDDFTILMFVVSAVGFFIWRLAVELNKLENKQQAS